MALNPRITELLDRQLGVVSRQQLLAAGVASPHVDALVRRGHLERMDHGVYRRSGSGSGPQQDEVVAVLRCGPRARISGARLLGHLGVEGFSVKDPFVVLVPPGRRVRGGRVQARLDHAPELHGAMYGAVAGTTPGRALVELAMRSRRDVTGGSSPLTDAQLLSVYDRMRWRGVVAASRIAAVVADLPRHLGARRVGRLLGTTAAVVESPGERRLEAELRDIEPPLEWQVWVAPDLRVDALWRDLSLVLEYQGARTHDDVRDRVNDAGRHDRLRALGYEVLVIDRFDLRDPAALQARLQAARAHRRRELSGVARPA